MLSDITSPKIGCVATSSGVSVKLHPPLPETPVNGYVTAGRHPCAVSKPVFFHSLAFRTLTPLFDDDTDLLLLAGMVRRDYVETLYNVAPSESVSVRMFQQKNSRAKEGEQNQERFH